MRTSSRPASGYSLTVIFAIPLVLGVLSIVGLISALVGDDLWDVASWVTLGVPVAVTAWFLRPGRR